MMIAADHPLSSYLARLQARGALDNADCAAFLSLRARVEIHRPGSELVRQGQAVNGCVFLIDGFISRTKIMKNKQRQILAFCIPGDAVDLQTLFLDYADHSLEAHASTTIAVVPQADIARLMHLRPHIMRALWLETSIEAAIFREWAVNLGQRTARQRIAHLLLELEARYRACAHIDKAFSLPVKQAGLAGAVGLSLVHLNKSLQWLKREGLVAVQGRMFQIIKRQELIDYCGFEPEYLHLNQLEARGRQPDALVLRSSIGQGL